MKACIGIVMGCLSFMVQALERRGSLTATPGQNLTIEHISSEKGQSGER